MKDKLIAVIIILLLIILFLVLLSHLTLEARVKKTLSNYFQESGKTEIINLYE